MAETEDYDKSAIPTAHKTSHQDGGSDEINVAALSGELADEQKSAWSKVSGKPTTFAPEAHKTLHQAGGSDIVDADTVDTQHRVLTINADHTHQSTGAQGGKLDHGLALDGLADDDHTQYIKHSLATAVNDFLVASGVGVFVKKTLAEVKTILGLGSAAYTAATDYVTHALATAASDFLVASGSGAFVKKTLAETIAILAHKTSHQDAGLDEISVAGLSGLLADDQHVLDTEVETVIQSRQKARAYRAAAQVIPNAAWTKIEIDTDSFDPYNITDLPNNRIKPTNAGYYFCFAQATINQESVSTEFLCSIYKNSAPAARGNRFLTSGSIASALVGDLIYVNGTTDYLELFMIQFSGASRGLEVYLTNNFLTILGPF